jgi:hypothetical protein
VGWAACGKYGKTGGVGKPEIRTAAGKSRRRWDNIKMELQKLEWVYAGWIDVVRDSVEWRAVVNAVMNFRVS